MWTKIFRSKSSSKYKSDGGEVERIACEHDPGVHRSKFAKVVNSFSLKRHGSRQGSLRKVNVNYFTPITIDGPRSLEEFGSNGSSDHSNEFELPDIPIEVDIRLEPCAICTRTFAPATLKKHILICEKTVTKKRKKFDSSRQRREGTDLADFLPRNFGLPPTKQQQQQQQEPKALHTDKVGRQVTTPVLQRKEIEPVKTTPPPSIKTPITPTTTLPLKKTVSPVINTTIGASKEKPKPILSRLVATAQPCPYCGRSFGTKAYDRHVEWCKEKTRISNPQHNQLTNVAKERLQARTKYRAPCLKTRRGVNREKYSGLSCEDSNNSLSDGGSIGSAAKHKDYSQDIKGNMDVSMTSSIMSSSMLSDGGLSDKYDPFLSAKRQLEELCSPTDPTPPITSLPATPNIKTKPSDHLMSKSYTSTSATNKLSNIKSNFTRTLSLRVPRKTTPTRTIFPATTQQKPTIQRGISDEGPISSKFLKPEEYDEMPVKSVCINDYAAASRQQEHHSTPKIVKREPTTNRNRRNMKMNLGLVGRKDTNPLSKTDSLAIFLHYENATRVSDVAINSKLTEKDLKDKSNTLSKQTSSKSSASDLDSIFNDKDKLCSLKNSLSSLLDPNNAGIDSHLIRDTNPISVTKLQAIKLEPLPKMLPKSDRFTFNPYPLNPKENDYIDPKLINVCDNLPINVTKLSDNDSTASSTESMEKAALQTESRFELSECPEGTSLNQPVVLRNSTERKNLLKRQLRLGKNHFLYDHSPEDNNFSSEREQNMSSSSVDSNKFDSNSSTIDPVPDEFDIEEFISSFDNADEYPLFKDYKAFLSNRSLNKLSNNSRESSRSPMTSSRNQNDDLDDGNDDIDREEEEIEKNEIFSSNESFLKHENEILPYSTPCHSENNSTRSAIQRNENLNDLNENFCDLRRIISRSENEEEAIHDMDMNRNIENDENEKVGVHEDNEISNANIDLTENPKDLSKPSSLESLEIKKSVSSKQSADSAYGSLSRHSPIERKSRRSSTLRSSIPTTPADESQIKMRNMLVGSSIDTKRRSRDLSNDSSSSEVSSSFQQRQHDRDHHHNLRTLDFDINRDRDHDHRMSKFCHECGNKFIVITAKFCMECGVRRIVLD